MYSCVLFARFECLLKTHSRAENEALSLKIQKLKHFTDVVMYFWHFSFWSHRTREDLRQRPKTSLTAGLSDPGAQLNCCGCRGVNIDSAGGVVALGSGGGVRWGPPTVEDRPLQVIQTTYETNLHSKNLYYIKNGVICYVPSKPKIHALIYIYICGG